jgi:signal transduction histidine kinase
MADVVLAVALLVCALVAARETADFQSDYVGLPVPDAAGSAACLAAVILPLALRRRAPLAVVLTSTTAFIAYVALLGPNIERAITAIALGLAVYNAAAHGYPQRRDWVCASCLVAIIGLIVLENPYGAPLQYQWVSLLHNVALFCAFWSLGAALGSGRRRGKELLQRTRELEHEREENARRAVFDERVRIARELHDVVAHHVSMMGVQAGAARVTLASDPAKAKEALASIETSSRQAVLELHRLLGFLRQAGDHDDLAPQLGLAELESLVTSLSGSELNVEIRVEGKERSLPPLVDVSAYRIVQEALTNTLKHADASRADVHVRYLPDELELEIVDDGFGEGAASTTPGGLGLIGMRERTALHGGTLTAGATSGGGFAVRVRLPTTTAAL